MQKIGNFEVLNLPPRNGEIHWEIGQKLHAQESNLLLAGDNGSGKSTMLQIFYDSLWRAQDVLNGKDFGQYKNVVDLFFQISNALDTDPVFATGGNVNLHLWFNNFLVRENGSTQIDEWIKESKESDIDEEVYRTIDILLKHVFGIGIEVFIDGSFSCTKGQLESELCSVFHDSKIDMLSSRDKEEISAGIMVEFIARGARIYGERNNIPEEVMYGNLLFLALKIHPGQSDGGSKWGYVKPFVQDEKKLLQAERFVFSDKEEKGELSQGQHTQSRMAELFELVEQTSTGVIAFLDEPTNGLSRKAKRDLLDLLDTPNEKLQIFAASHDGDFQSMAFSQNTTWIGYDLDEGMSSTEMYMREE